VTPAGSQRRLRSAAQRGEDAAGRGWQLAARRTCMAPPARGAGGSARLGLAPARGPCNGQVVVACWAHRDLQAVALRRCLPSARSGQAVTARLGHDG
jgi:hypothetical protein